MNKKQEMNEDLKKWLSDEEKKKLSKKIKTHQKQKKITGKCHVCNTNKATTICIKCERSVCNACYYHLVGLCESCLSPEIVEKWKIKKPDLKEDLGVDWVD